jgi:flagellar FlgN protein
MMAILQELIEALRTELQQYGEMLALLEQQGESIRTRGAESLSISVLESQSGAIQEARNAREVIQTHLAAELSQQANGSLGELLPYVPEQYRPLLNALAQENKELIERVRQRAQQNQLLMRHSVVRMQHLILNLSPTDSSATFNPAEDPLLAEESASPLAIF